MKACFENSIYQRARISRNLFQDLIFYFPGHCCNACNATISEPSEIALSGGRSYIVQTANFRFVR